MTKIDAHVHFNTMRFPLLEYGKSNNFRFLSINTNIPFFKSVEAQEDTILELRQKYGERINYVTTFQIEGWGTEGWASRAIESIKESIKNGAIGVKVWKNIGMTLRDDDGNYVFVDDDSFDPIFDFLEQNNIVVLGHIGEPKNCWLPLEKMTVDQDRKYFVEHPEYHMYLHPECPSYEEHLKSRNRRLIKNPSLKFVGLHLSSQEWETNEVGHFLDKFPQAAVDLAERICHLQHQSITDWKKVRAFFLKFQDRIIYGSDVIDDNTLSDHELVKRIDIRYQRHWEFFVSDKVMTAPKVTGEFKGLSLPDEVVEKIYYRNALNWYTGLRAV